MDFETDRSVQHVHHSPGDCSFHVKEGYLLTLPRGLPSLHVNRLLTAFIYISYISPLYLPPLVSDLPLLCRPEACFHKTVCKNEHQNVMSITRTTNGSNYSCMSPLAQDNKNTQQTWSKISLLGWCVYR